MAAMVSTFDVVEHDRRVVAAQLEGDALEVGGRADGDLLAAAHRAGEADLAGDAVGGHRGAEVVAAGYHVDHARRHDLVDELAEAQRGEGRVRRGLEHDRVAGPEGRRQLPHGQAEREVPRRDRRDDAERAVGDLDQGVVVVLQHLAGDLEAGVVLEPGVADRRFGRGHGKRLPRLLRQHRRELGGRRKDGGTELQHQLAASAVIGLPTSERR